MSPAIVDKFITTRLAVVKPGTVARDVAALRDWLAWQEEREMTGPIRSQYLLGRVVEKRKPDRFSLTDAQAEWLLQRARWIHKGQRSLKFTEPGSGKRKSAWCEHWPPNAFHLFCRLGLELGLRPRELFWLAWEDFHETSAGLALAVQSHCETPEGAHGPLVIINELKSEASRRRLLVPEDVAKLLDSFRKQQEAAGELRRFLFAVRTPAGEWRKPEIHFIFKALKEEAGEPRLVCNTLRKTCGQRLRRQGRDYFAIAQFLGHSPTTTMRYYVQDCREDEAFDPATCAPVRLRRAD